MDGSWISFLLATYGNPQRPKLYRDCNGWFDPLRFGVYPCVMKNLIAPLLVLGLMACEPSPSEVYEEARSAADNHAWEQALSHFDSKTRALFTGLDDISELTSRKLSYGVKLEKLHQWGDILEETIEGNRASLKVGREKHPKWVFFIVEEGSWKIRGCEMDELWVMP